MGIELLIGPIGNCKTEAAMGIFGYYTPVEHKSIRFIVPSYFQVERIVSSLLSDPQIPGLLGDPVCTLNEFCTDLMQPSTPKRRISDSARESALADLAAQCTHTLFAGISDSPGFPGALGSTLDSLRSAGITAHDLRRTAEGTRWRGMEDSKQRIVDLSVLYKHYEGLLSDDATHYDDEGLVAECAYAIASGAADLERFTCVIFDGFLNYTPSQLSLLRAIGARAGKNLRLIVSMDYVENDSSYSLNEESYRVLINLPDAHSQACTTDGLPRNSIRSLNAVFSNDTSACRETDDSVVILSVSDPSAEVECVAEEIVELLTSHNLSPGDIAIGSTDVGSYREIVGDTLRKFRLSLRGESRPLESSPLCEAITAALRIILDEWEYSSVITALRSRYILKSAEESSRIVQWAAGVEPNSKSDWLRECGEAEARSDARIEALKPIDALERGLAGAHTGEEFLSAIISFVSAILGSANLSNPRDDSAAWSATRQIVMELMEDENVCDEGAVLRSTERLISRIRNEYYQLLASSESGITFGSLATLAGPRHRVLFLLGMVRTPNSGYREDPYLRDVEIELLNRKLARRLATRMERELHGRHLFYSAVCGTADRVYLCYPRTSFSGKDSVRSTHLDEIEGAFNGKLRHR